MSHLLTIRVEGHAQPAGSKRIGRHGDRPVVLDANPRSRDWKNLVALAASEARREAGLEVLEGPLRVEMTFRVRRPKSHLRADGTVKPSAPHHPTGKPDVLKLARAAEDALSGVVYADDALIVEELLLKDYACPHHSVGVVIVVSRPLKWECGACACARADRKGRMKLGVAP